MSLNAHKSGGSNGCEVFLPHQAGLHFAFASKSLLVRDSCYPPAGGEKPQPGSWAGFLFRFVSHWFWWYLCSGHRRFIGSLLARRHWWACSAWLTAKQDKIWINAAWDPLISVGAEIDQWKMVALSANDYIEGFCAYSLIAIFLVNETIRLKNISWKVNFDWKIVSLGHINLKALAGIWRMIYMRAPSAVKQIKTCLINKGLTKSG